MVDKPSPGLGLVPSKVLQSTWLYSEPSIHTLLQDYDIARIGKWMLFLDCKDVDENGLTKLDLCWPFITSLVDEGILIDAKCSTALSYAGQSKGVIICYTDDYTNKDKVKKVADSIRKVVDYPQPIYYKTANVGQTVSYRRSGEKAISIYQHAIDYKFYERDEFAQWKLVKASKLRAP